MAKKQFNKILIIVFISKLPIIEIESFKKLDKTNINKTDYIYNNTNGTI